MAGSISSVLGCRPAEPALKELVYKVGANHSTDDCSGRRDELPGDETMTRWTLAAALLALLMAPTPVMAQDAGAVRSAHEDLEPGTRTDDLGITIGIPASHPARRYPASHEFPTGPVIGERLPEFALPNQRGRIVDYHADRGDSKSIVVFYRSAVW